MSDQSEHAKRLCLERSPAILRNCDGSCQFMASSGGIVSGLIKYLFETGKIKNAISYEFDASNLYAPKLISSFKEYRIVGSIYHEVDLINFIKDSLSCLSGPLAVVCLPCQVKAIRYLLKEGGVTGSIIALTCSAQLSKDATYYMYDRLKIKKTDVLSLRYRGNGWPSGVQIETTSRRHFLPNRPSLWFDIFHSHIFTLRRCFWCRDTFGINADITVADPWLRHYMEKDTIGHTLVLVHNTKGALIVEDSIRQGYLECIEEIDVGQVVASQKATLDRKMVFRDHQILFRFLSVIFKSRLYGCLLKCTWYLRFHRIVFNKMILLLSRSEKLH